MESPITELTAPVEEEEVQEVAVESEAPSIVQEAETATVEEVITVVHEVTRPSPLVHKRPRKNTPKFSCVK